MKHLVYDKENGELRCVTDFFAALQAFPTFRFASGVKVGSTVAPGDKLLVMQIAGKKPVALRVPSNCRGTINGLGDWGADMAEPPSKVFLYIHPSSG